MALFVLIGVLRGFPAAAYRRTPHRKPLCGLDQNKNCSFLNWTPIVFILYSWMDNRSHLKNRILIQGQGGYEVQPAGILKYSEELKRGPNTEIWPKDFFEIASN
jgi:hypothetical protein